MLSSVGPVALISPWAMLQAICWIVGNVLGEATAAVALILAAAGDGATVESVESELVLAVGAVVVSSAVSVFGEAAAAGAAVPAGAAGDCASAETELVLVAASVVSVFAEAAAVAGAVASWADGEAVLSGAEEDCASVETEMVLAVERTFGRDPTATLLAVEPLDVVLVVDFVEPVLPVTFTLGAVLM